MKGSFMGKGSDRRPYDKNKWDEEYERIFGKKEPIDFQKEKKDIKKVKNRKE